MNDLFSVRVEARAIDRALRKMLDKARAAGIKNPGIYFEAEGSVYVMDQDHPGEVNGHNLSAARRQDAVVAQGDIPTPHDVGAW